VEYFDRLWTAAGGTPELFELRRSFLASHLSWGDRVLDVGCGDGWFCEALARDGFAVAGTDVSAVAIGRARERCPGVEFAVCGETALPFGDGAFDVAWLGEVLEHVRDGLGLLAEAARVVGPGGRLLVSTPGHPWSLRLRLGVDRRAFESHFEPRADHLRFFTRRTLAELLDAGGFESVAVRARGGALLVSATVR
jgi:2-polyprenyl-3-methyl-5-hydroxy-6-metoxy-1,4-benzoquinol methylase